MMTGTVSKRSPDPDRPSLLLPSGATLSVAAALLEGLGEGDLIAQALALFGAAAALAAWILVTRKGGGTSPSLGVRFFSIFAIALAISGLFINVGGGWLGTVGVIGLWLACGGAAVEWMRGRTYSTNEAVGE